MESFKPITDRDLEIINMGVDGYDSVQITLSKLVNVNHGTERQTLKSAFVSIEELRLLQSGRVLEEPRLTQMIQIMDSNGIDPMQFIRFVGDRAIQL